MGACKRQPIDVLLHIDFSFPLFLPLFPSKNKKKINKIDKPLTRLIKRKRERTQVNEIRSERGEVTTGTTEIQKVVTKYYEELHANKLEKLEKVIKS